MNKQRTLEKLLVEELRKRESIEDVICEYNIESLRVCNTCHRLMNEGWIYNNCETYCSDKCLMKSHPDENIAKMKERASEDYSETYWTVWEG